MPETHMANGQVPSKTSQNTDMSRIRTLAWRSTAQRYNHWAIKVLAAWCNLYFRNACNRLQLLLNWALLVLFHICIPLFVCLLISIKDLLRATEINDHMNNPNTDLSLWRIYNHLTRTFLMANRSQLPVEEIGTQTGKIRIINVVNYCCIAGCIIRVRGSNTNGMSFHR